jgi:hypothetical protein
VPIRGADYAELLHHTQGIEQLSLLHNLVVGDAANDHNLESRLEAFLKPGNRAHDPFSALLPSKSALSGE